MAGIAEIVAGAVKGTADTGLGIWNAYQDYKRFQYQKDLQREIFAREDNAIQRRVADAEKAGFNKFSVIGEGSSAGATVPLQAPHISEDLGSKIADSLSTMYSLAQQKALAKQADINTKEKELAFTLSKNDMELFKAQQLQSLGFNVAIGSNPFGEIQAKVYPSPNHFGEPKKYFSPSNYEMKNFNDTPEGKVGLNYYAENQSQLNLLQFKDQFKWLEPIVTALQALNQTAGTVNAFRKPRHWR